MALNYTSVDRIYDLVPEIGSLHTLSSAQVVSAFATPAEAEIHGYIVRQYTVPVSPAPDLLRSIADDLATYRILSRRVFTTEQLKASDWVERFKEALVLLKKIADGEVLLVDANGTLIAARTDVADATSNTKDYLPTFHEGGQMDQIVDPDKLDDLEDARSL